MTRRRGGTCLFCGSESKKLTREHVFPKWFSSLEGIEQPEWVNHIKVRSGDGIVIRSFEQNKSDPGPVVWGICAPCNNGWMSVLEQGAKPLMVKFLAYQAFVPLPGVQVPYTQRKVLAAWVSKMALLWEFTTAGPTMISQDDLTTLYTTKSSPRHHFVQLGVASEEHAIIDVRRFAYVHPAPGGGADLDKSWLTWTMYIGSVVLHVAIPPAHRRDERAFVPFGQSAGIRLWPERFHGDGGFPSLTVFPPMPESDTNMLQFIDDFGS